MTIKKKLFFVFAAIILLVPVYVAVSSQNVLNNGTFYKFKPMAYDPFDPFRGKFLSVNYSTDFVPTKFDFDEDETVYVSIGVDNEGFAFFEEFLPAGGTGEILRHHLLLFRFDVGSAGLRTAGAENAHHRGAHHRRQMHHATVVADKNCSLFDYRGGLHQTEV